MLQELPEFFRGKMELNKNWITKMVPNGKLPIELTAHLIN